MKKEVCVISIYVNSIEDAKKHYCEALGFEIEHEYGDCIVQLKTTGVTLVLEKIEDNYPPHPCVVPGFPTEDVLSELKTLREQGVELLHEEPQVFPGGVFAGFKDISGNIFELLEFKAQ